jgi:chromosomal replication initiator protein
VSLPARHTFDEFVVGNSNRFAHAASRAVADAPGTSYNPLFLHGGAGLGKTHLLHAIGRRVFARNPDATIAYVAGENFATDNRYRHVDALLIDDIQHLERNEQSQEEVFHTFNALLAAQKQIVIASDRPASEIRTRDPRLRQRFEWGLLTPIDPPDFETRVAILRQKAQFDRVAVPADVLTYIAKIVSSDVRALHAALTRVISFAALNNVAITLEIATAVFE